MNIIVTGATGFVGKEFIKSVQNKYNIYVLVRKASDTSVLKDINCKIIVFNDYDEINNIFLDNTIKGIVHFASNIIVEHKSNDIKGLIDSNITFGTYLLEACIFANVEWFLNTGTFWQNYNNEDYNPVNLYASSKEAFENISKFYTETSNLIFTTIKLNDTFGPNDTRNKIFNLWINLLKSDKTLDMSAGEQTIDISYIYDIVNAYDTMIENFKQDNISKYNNKTFVISNKEKPTLKELSKIFEDVTNSKLNINWGARNYRDRETMKPYFIGINVPNWQQKFTLKEAIKNTIKDIKND